MQAIAAINRRCTAHKSKLCAATFKVQPIKEQPMKHALASVFAMMAFCVFMFTPVARADDAADIKAVIESQLNAFATDNGPAAYAHAAPIVQGIFPTVDGFMSMVKKGYQPVYRNTARIFGDIFQDNLNRPAMRVVLTGQDGKRYEALYAMEKQQDGSWKIAGCVIIAIPAQEV
jgi:Domain of unknown function (DUF4864)